MRHIQTKFAFVKLLRTLDCDLVLDVGSRDGQEAIIFSRATNGARVIAFEANPHNASHLRNNPNFKDLQIELEELAAWNRMETIDFHVTCVNHDDDRSNTGTSSIKPHMSLEQERVSVQAVRLDDFVRTAAPKARRIAVWVDVEGAEAEVLEGLEGIMDRIVLLHVETATKAMHVGQRLLGDVDALMTKCGMKQIGQHMDGGHWGDLLYVRQSLPPQRYLLPVVAAYLLKLFPRRRLATALFHRAPRAHAALKRQFRHSALLSGY